MHLLGTSWGGMLALERALARAGTARGLVLSSTLASAPEWVGEVRRLRDAIEIASDDEDAERELDARHVFRGDPEREEIRPHARAREVPRCTRRCEGERSGG